MAKEEIILTIPRCKFCGSKETISQKAWKYVYPDDKEIPFTQLGRTLVPLTAHTSAVNISLPTIPAAGISMDACAECGVSRVTKVIKIVISGEQMAAASGMNPQGPPRKA